MFAANKLVMQQKVPFFVVFIVFGAISTMAQSTAYVLQSGATLATQRWDGGLDRQPLLAWHGAIALESINNDDDRGSLFAQLGYHVKGSAVRVRYLNFGGTGAFQVTDRFKFNNISLILGAKQRKPFGSGNSRFFYFGGVRCDYTVSTNLDELLEANISNPYALAFYPAPGYVNKWIGGLSIGGGLEFPFGELIGGELKCSIHPDFTYQYNQPPIRNLIITDPLFQGQNNTIPERRIRNTAIELSLGLRLLRKVEIID
jgi:hypothetical protein